MEGLGRGKVTLETHYVIFSVKLFITSFCIAPFISAHVYHLLKWTGVKLEIVVSGCVTSSIFLSLHIAVDEVFAAVHHPLLPLLPREDLESVLSLLRHLDGTEGQIQSGLGRLH